MNTGSKKETIKSTCGLCPIGCGIIAHTKGDRVIKVEGDPDHPLNKGVLCPKGLASLEYLYHPERLISPLKRKGKRGGLNWQKITWDQALDKIANKMKESIDKYGLESIGCIHGAAKGLQDSYLTRLANVLGTPNIVWQGHVCFVPRMLASVLTYGFYAIPDYDNLPSCIVVWGKNTEATLHHAHQRILKCLQKNTKLIVIDPRETELSQKADMWLQIRPGQDLQLALAMLSEIVNNDLYDKDFVYNWTEGFQEFKEHIQNFTTERAEKLTWINLDKIKQAARIYAESKPACIQWGNSIDQGVNNFQTARAICILRSITGNVGVPGGEIQPESIPLNGRRSPQLELWDEISTEKRNKSVDTNVKLPMIKNIAPQNLTKAIIEEEPYSIRNLFIQGANPVITYPNAKRVYNALLKSDFLVVSDMFMTPTAALADIVLPAASYLEFDSLVTPPYSYPVVSVQQRTTRIKEARSDYEILSELAQKLGLDKYFWSSEQECLDYVLKPLGITFEEFRNICYIARPQNYRVYKTDGFLTPSRKIEIYSHQLKGWDFAPFPTPRNDLYAANDINKHIQEYPYILTSWKSEPFRHSGGRQITSLRGIQPDPLVYIHPDTAEKEDLADGQWTKIVTAIGSIWQKVYVTSGILPNVLGLAYAWWYPENKKKNLYDWSESNVNILIDDNSPYSLETGATQLRGVACRICKE